MEQSPQVEVAKPICVVIDTCIWRSELLLRTPRGAALLFCIRQSRGALGMPEVIESEITKQAVAAGVEFIEKIESNLRMLGSLVGYTHPYVVPSLKDLEARTQARIQELKDLFLPVPFT